MSNNKPLHRQAAHHRALAMVYEDALAWSNRWYDGQDREALRHMRDAALATARYLEALEARAGCSNTGGTAGTSAPCPVCGRVPGDCICPECPVCGRQGAPGCYDDLVHTLPARDELERESGRRGHGLRCTPGQVESFNAMAHAAAEQNQAGAEWAEQWRRDQEAGEDI